MNAFHEDSSKLSIRNAIKLLDLKELLKDFMWHFYNTVLLNE